VIVLGIVLAALGLGGLLFTRLRLPIGIIALLVAIAAGVVIVTAVPPILTEIDNMASAGSGVSVTVGYGLIISAVGAAAAALGAIWAILAARR
jgi:hypothetical protein